VVSFPVFIPTFSFVAFLERDENEPIQSTANLRVTLGETEVAAQQVSIEFEGKLRTKFTARFGGMPIMSAGNLTFVFSLGEAVSSWTVPIEQVSPPAHEQPD